MIKSRSLAFELLYQLALVAVIPIIITIGFFYWKLLPQLKQNIIEEQQSIAGLATQQTQTLIANAIEQVDMFIALSEDYSSTGIYEQIDTFIQRNVNFETIYFINNKGSIQDIAIRHTPPKMAHKLYRDMDISKSQLFQKKLFTEDTGWSEVFLSVVTGRISIAYFTRVDDSILIAELAIDQLPNLSKELAELGIILMLLDNNNQLIAHPDPELSQQQINLSNIDLFKYPIENNVRSGSFNWLGQDLFGTQVRMKELGWSIIVAEDEQRMNAQLTDPLQNMVGAMLIILLLALFLSYRQSNRFNLRFGLLKRQSTKVAHGQYDIQQQYFRIKEFQELSDDLVAMADAIQKREQVLHDKESELIELTNVLEQRVEERTQSLQKTNQELANTVEALNSTMEQLVQSEKLASLGSLVAGVAHELNTPIGNAAVASSSLNDFAKDIQRQLENGSITKSNLEKFLHDAQMASGITARNLERASELITSFKNIAADQSSSQRRSFNLKEIVQEILMTLHPKTKKQPIEIVTEVDGELKLDSYPGPLEQVLNNLILNAFLHAFEEDQTGQVKIESKALNQDMIEIHVSDNGKGIPIHDQPKVFDPFFTTKLGQGGSGLGLHICHNIVTDTLGGTLTVKSTLNEGSRFTITIPASAPTYKES